MNTRHVFSFVSLLLVSILVTGCGKKESADEHEHKVSSSDEWKEMDSFHIIMAETFHPFKDSANLEPVKVHGSHLAMEAETWAGTALPDKVNNDQVKAKLDQLKKDTRALADTISHGATDEVIGTQLTAVHDLFHEIQEAWYGGHSKEHH